MRKKIFFVVLLLSIWSIGKQTSFAQATASATLEGTVTDKAQAVIKGATVTVSNKATGVTRTTSTNDAGVYRFELLAAGKYDIRVSASGFASAVTESAELLVGRATTLDYNLNPGAAAETVTVTAETPIVDTQKTDVGLNITPQQLNDLPLNGRDFANLAILAPGAKPVDSYDPTKNRIAVFGINGSSGRNVNVTVNGVDNKDNTVGGPVMQLPLGAVQEYVISTQRFSAANGRSEGAAVNVVSKSGSNAFHGGAYVYERNERFNATEVDPITGETRLSKSPYSRQQYGGSIGGPVYKDKTFFFFAFEKAREITNIIVNSDALAELNLVKSLGAQPAANIPTPYRDTRYNGRLDYRFNEKHNAFLSYTAQSNKGENDQSGATNDLTGGNFTKNELQIANATLVSTLTSNIVNSFTTGFQYWNNLIDSAQKVPNVTFPGSIFFGTNVNVPQQSYQRKWQFRDDISIIKGRHSFKTGFDFVWEPQLGGFFEFNPTPEFDFLEKPSAILANTAKYPQGLASPGALKGMTATAGDPYFNLPGGAKMFGVYFQDDWKFSSRLTLNLGVRYDRDSNLLAGDTVQSASRTYQALKAINSPYAADLPHDDGRNISPRIGFAYDIFGNSKHVLRGGYGLYYGQTFLNIPLFMIQQTNPTLFATVFSITSTGPGDPKAGIVPGTNIKLSDYRFGVDPLPTIPAAPAQLSAGNVGRLIDPNYRNPYTQQFNVGYSYELTPTSAIEVEYTHVLGLRESKTININPQRVALLPPGSTDTPPRELDAAFVAAGLPKLGRIDVESSVGRARYDGLNLSYRRRLSNRFSVNASYVLSRAVAYNGASAAFRNRATDVDDIFAGHDFGPTPNDERHRFVVSGLVDLPKGIQFAPIMQIASARPYNSSMDISDLFSFGSGVGAIHAIVNTSAPDDLLANKDKSAADLVNCLAAGSCVQAPFDNLRGQAFFQLDARVSKDIKLSERAKLKLIFQAFDLTNRANFGNSFDGNVNSSTFRKPLGFITPSGVFVPRSFSGEFGAQFIF
ncbi:MAG TPA: carboxypeptidase regulatory-like domain-containing protein [Blastocatellia bacterium]|jgi:outer membrane receptor protein involved in Fe transport|nr:carboxypeptidase regulatory-like domain-containing protein [Blastocatellia bacterium]